MDWKEESIEGVWQHGRVMPDADPAVWRQDACGAWIRRGQFGDSHSEFGWKIEKVAGGAPDTLENLRPFHWRNHFDIAGNKSHCQVKADRVGEPAGEYARPPRNRGV
jgi:hypothetical protein